MRYKTLLDRHYKHKNNLEILQDKPILSNIKAYRITQALVDWYVERMNFITKSD